MPHLPRLPAKNQSSTLILLPYHFSLGPHLPLASMTVRWPVVNIELNLLVCEIKTRGQSGLNGNSLESVPLSIEVYFGRRSDLIKKYPALGHWCSTET